MNRATRVARATLALTVLASTATLAQVRAQTVSPPPVVSGRALTSSAALDSGVIAYEDVSYNDAVRLLRLALTGRGADTLGPAARSTALMYLGAAEWFLQHRDSANAVFRALLAHAPRHRADSLIFPKGITDFFDGIRKSLHGLARVRATDRGIRVTVFAINPHRVSVDVFTEGGTRLVGLYEGLSADSLSLDWDERGADGRRVAAGRYDVVVTARGMDGVLLSVARFPVVIERVPGADWSGR